MHIIIKKKHLPQADIPMVSGLSQNGNLHFVEELCNICRVVEMVLLNLSLFILKAIKQHTEIFCWAENR